VVEGPTEYYCVPCIIGRLGHISVGAVALNGGFDDWEKTIRVKVVPRVVGMSERKPDKILVVLDREGRVSCCPDLAKAANEIVQAECHIECDVAFVISDPKFEATIFADYDNVDKLRILSERISHHFGEKTDGVNVLGHLNRAKRNGTSYDKIAHGHALAQKLTLNNPVVLARSRALRKLLKEVPHP
jgi:hypothetical protein